MLRLAAYTPDTPPHKVAELAESQLGHLEVFDDDVLLAHIVIRPLPEANEVENWGRRPGMGVARPNTGADGDAAA